MKGEERGELIADKYELLEIAGRGGMATVWRAVSRGAAGFERDVALKRILPSFVSNSEFVKMFVEEARVGSQLIHPHIVQIIDFGQETAGGYFLVMEWVEGLDLGRYLRSFHRQREHAPWPLVCAICIEALRGLRAAHERQEGMVIHRDLNPQNILIGLNGIAKLTDFGLSRAMDRARMTRPDIVKGKLSYLAPELTRGGSPSAQSDLFGAGIVLWEALTARHLFRADNDVNVLLKVRDCEIPQIAELRPDLPPSLHQVVHQALQKDPQRRFKSAHQMIRALSNVLRTVPDDTDGRVIGKSVQTARDRLAVSAGALV